MKKRRPATPESGRRPPQYRSRWPWSLLIILLGLLAANYIFHWVPWPWDVPPQPAEAPRPAVTQSVSQSVTLPATQPRQEVIDYDKLKDRTDPTLQAAIDDRKDDFGLTDSVDMVAREEETIKVGGETVSLSEILAEIGKNEGEASKQPDPAAAVDSPAGREMTASDLANGEAGQAGARPGEPAEIRKQVQFYGIYVVRAGDNLWNIHFAILREYLKHKGIETSPNADARTAGGTSSGVGRILKDAESMVHIFNVRTKTLDRNLNLLKPDEKVVIFNLTRLENILGQINAGNIDTVVYDGKELYLPGHEPKDEEATKPTAAGTDE